MSDPCEIVESVAVGSSSAPAIENVVVGVTAAFAVSALFLGLTPATLVNTGDATDAEDIDTYALCVGSAAVAETALPTMDITNTRVSSGVAKSIPYLGFVQTYATTAASTSVAVDETVIAPILSVADADSFVFPNTAKTSTLVSSGRCSDWIELGLYELVVSEGDGAGTPYPTRTTVAVSVSDATGSSLSYETSVPTIALLVSNAVAVSTSYWQADFTFTAESSADAESSSFARDPSKLAWVMNTETTAASVYDNFDFNSLAFTPSAGLFGVGESGLYLLDGDTDAGDIIGAEVASGFTDFKNAQQKRIDGVYFGYTSDGQIELTLDTKDSLHSAYTYTIGQASASAPTNGRVIPGKGMYGRYWRMTLRNVDGADFEINDASVDLAISARRL